MTVHVVGETVIGPCPVCCGGTPGSSVPCCLNVLVPDELCADITMNGCGTFSLRLVRDPDLDQPVPYFGTGTSYAWVGELPAGSLDPTASTCIALRGSASNLIAVLRCTNLGCHTPGCGSPTYCWKLSVRLARTDVADDGSYDTYFGGPYWATFSTGQQGCWAQTGGTQTYDDFCQTAEVCAPFSLTLRERFAGALRGTALIRAATTPPLCPQDDGACPSLTGGPLECRLLYAFLKPPLSTYVRSGDDQIVFSLARTGSLVYGGRDWGSGWEGTFPGNSDLPAARYGIMDHKGGPNVYGWRGYKLLTDQTWTTTPTMLLAVNTPCMSSDYTFRNRCPPELYYVISQQQDAVATRRAFLTALVTQSGSPARIRTRDCDAGVKKDLMCRFVFNNEGVGCPAKTDDFSMHGGHGFGEVFSTFNPFDIFDRPRGFFVFTNSCRTDGVGGVICPTGFFFTGSTRPAGRLWYGETGTVGGSFYRAVTISPVYDTCVHRGRWLIEWTFTESRDAGCEVSGTSGRDIIDATSCSPFQLDLTYVGFGGGGTITITEAP